MKEELSAPKQWCDSILFSYFGKKKAIFGNLEIVKKKLKEEFWGLVKPSEK